MEPSLSFAAPRRYAEIPTELAHAPLAARFDLPPLADAPCDEPACSAEPAPELATAEAREAALSQLWRAVRAGRWTIARHRAGPSCRFVTVRQNDAARSAHARLTPREERAVWSALRGGANKELAYELGVSTSTSWMITSCAFRKMGIQSRVELTELFARLSESRVIESDDCPAAGDEDTAERTLQIPLHRLEPPACLTKAQREVVLGVLDAKSNREIAILRRTSVHTVANQLRSVYVKLGISGRSQLLAML